ncbi:MAG: NUDIX hydrolase [Chlorobiaceae bacterium]|nr:NUDIX hydrolase [Chlorobiaceae bacterium]
MAKATVAAVVYPATGQRDTVLLTRRDVAPFKGCWCLPGGHIDAFEPVETAVRREVFEETGLDFEPSGFLGWFDEIFPEHRFHAVVLAFSGPGSGTPAGQPGEVADIAWFPLDEAIAMPLAFNHNLVLQRHAASINP